MLDVLWSFAVLALCLLPLVPVVAIGCLVLIKLGIWRPGRDRQEHLIITGMATVVRQNLPMPLGMTVASRSETGIVGYRLAQIGKNLSHGMSVSDAVRVGYPECTGIVLSLIMAGERAGQLPAALTQAAQALERRQQDRWSRPVRILPYAALVLVWASVLMTIMLVMITPRYEEIMQDFDVKGPFLFRTIAGAVSPLGSIVLMLFTPLLTLIAWLAYMSNRPRRVPQPSSFSRFADWFRWYVPGLRRFHFGAGMSTVAATLRFALRSGMSLEEAARLTATTVDVNWNLRKRVQDFADEVSRGANPAAAASNCGLGRVLSTALAGGRRSGNIDSALRYAADYYSALMSRWWTLARNLVFPLTTIALAIVVALFCLAMFLPLVALLKTMISSVGY